MVLKINGEEFTIEDGLSILQILKKLEILDRAMAVALNTNVIKKDNWESTYPKEGDKIEFLEFVGGG